MTNPAATATRRRPRGSATRRLSLLSVLALAAGLLAVIAGASPAFADHGPTRTYILDITPGQPGPPHFIRHSEYGQTIFLRAGVQDTSQSCLTIFPNCTAPTGTVYFYANGVLIASAEGGTKIDSRTRWFETTYCCLSPGTYTIQAFAQMHHFRDSWSFPVDYAVNKAGSEVLLHQSAATSTAGQPVSFSASVLGGNANSAQPTGSVQFTDNGAPLGAPVPLSSAGTAQTTAVLSPGSHTISAQYSGDGNFLPSEKQVVHTVQLAATSVSLTSNRNPSTAGEPVTFHAVVKRSVLGRIGGTVTFKVNGSVYGVVPVDGYQLEEHVWLTAWLGAGTHTVTAEYSGDANHAASASAALTQMVVRHQTTTALTSNLNPSMLGHPVSFRAVVSTSGPGTPTGTVRFMVGAGDAATTLGTATLEGGVATFTTSELGAGTQIVTAVYEGDASHDLSESEPLTQSVVACTITAPSTGGSTAGTPGNDVICGSSARDDIAGLGGDDIIAGFGGNDRLVGGDGNDTMSGGEGDDQLSGGAGNDTLSGDGGTDYAAGAGGTDACLAEHLADCEA